MSSVLPPNNNDRPFTVSSATDVGAEIATAIAEVKRVSPLDLSPLYSSIDCDALGNMFQHGTEKNTDWSIEFDHEGVRVTLSGDGTGRARSLVADK